MLSKCDGSCLLADVAFPAAGLYVKEDICQAFLRRFWFVFGRGQQQEATIACEKGRKCYICKETGGRAVLMKKTNTSNAMQLTEAPHKNDDWTPM